MRRYHTNLKQVVHSLHPAAKCWHSFQAGTEDPDLDAGPGPDDPHPLSEEEEKERQMLLDEGFKDWARRDFNAFVRACEKVGLAPLLSPFLEASLC